MTTIEKLIDALIQFRARIYYGLPEPKCNCRICKDLREVDKLYDKYESEKALLEKTQDWHEHGMIAPSCVGCPTAEAVIREDMVMVRREMIIGTIKTLEYIMESDKSEKYKNGEPRSDGVEPKAGQKFLTPSELALAELAHLHGLGFTTETEQ